VAAAMLLHALQSAITCLPATAPLSGAAHDTYRGTIVHDDLVTYTPALER
jgi:hypothetical protein